MIGNLHIKPDDLSFEIIALMEIWRCAVQEPLDEEDVVESVGHLLFTARQHILDEGDRIMNFSEPG